MGPKYTIFSAQTSLFLSKVAPMCSIVCIAAFSIIGSMLGALILMSIVVNITFSKVSFLETYMPGFNFV